MSSTARYPFEFRLLDWAEQFSLQISGARRAFFVGLREDGSVRRLYSSKPHEVYDGERKHTMARSHSVWFLYVPHDEKGSGYVEWYELDPGIVERWTARPLSPEDFADVRGGSAREGWPSSWRVLFR